MSTRSWSLTSQKTNSVTLQSAKHAAHSQIKALDISPTKTHAILAGREILKVIRVGSTEVEEDLNLRSYGLRYTPSKGPGPNTALDIHDVKWSHSNFSSCVATAASNGRINIYDINRAGTKTAQIACLHEHGRQVHRLAFNPHHSGYLLLSGSQDSTVKLWDLRHKGREALSFPSRETFHGQCESVRDLSWSPTDGVDFAFGTDTGAIQRWDFRSPRTPQLKINAHAKTCHAVDWHPDGKHLLSASSDRTIKVWRFSEGDRRQRPLWEIKAPYKVWGAKWRTACFSADYQDSSSVQTTQIAAFYRNQALVHIWDFRRPSLPYCEIREYNSQPSGMLWKSENLLWAVTGGDNGIFVQTNTQFSQKILDRRNLQAFGLSPDGEISCMLQKRPRRRATSFQYRGDLQQKNKKISPEKIALSRSFNDETVEEGFLSLSYKKRHGRSSSYRSAKSNSSTPTEEGSRVMIMTESMKGMLQGNNCDQLAFQGTLPGTVNSGLFTFLAQKYKAMPLLDRSNNEIPSIVESLFSRNAEYAQLVGCYRLAQSWKILGLAMSKALERRQQKRSISSYDNNRLEQNSGNKLLDPHGPRKGDDDSFGASRQMIKKNGIPPIHVESSSNMTTPLARPSTNISNAEYANRTPMASSEPDDDLALPPSKFDVQTQNNVPRKYANTALSKESSNKPYGSPRLYKTKTELDERRAKYGDWQAQPKVPLNLDPTGRYAGKSSPTGQLERLDSMDSFQMFSASSDSQGTHSTPNSFGSKYSESRNVNASSNWSTDIAQEGSRKFEKNPIRRTGEGNINGKSDEQGILDENALSAGRASQMSSKSTVEYDFTDNPASQPVFARSPYTSFDSDTSYTDSTRQDSFMMNNNDYTSVAGGELIQPTDSIGRDRIESKDLFENSGEIGNQNNDHVDEWTPEEERVECYDDDETVCGLPFAMVDMVRKLINYHSLNLGDSQTLSYFLLLLIPLLPPTHPLSRDEVATTLESYTEQFSGAGLSPDEIACIIERYLHPVTQVGINPLQVEAILSTYHCQLVSLNLYIAATRLRRMSYPAYPAVYDQSLKDISIGMLCQACNKPILNPKDKMRCENCRARQASCPICWSATSPYQNLDKKSILKRDERIFHTITTNPAQADDVCPKTLVDDYSNDNDNGNCRPSIGTQIETDGYNSKYLSPLPGLYPHQPTSAKATDNTHSSTRTKNGRGLDLFSSTFGSSSTLSQHEQQQQKQKQKQNTTSPHTQHGTSPSNLWTWCARCGHGGHMNCLLTWSSDPLSPNGPCPNEGCLCDCARGAARPAGKAASVKQRQQQQQQNKKPISKGMEMNGKNSSGSNGIVADGPHHTTTTTSTATGGKRVGFLRPPAFT